MKAVSIFVVVVAVVLAGCVTAPPVGTPSGNPEITLSNVRADCVKAGLLNGLINGGYRVESSNEYQIVAGKPTTNTLASLLLSTPANSTVEERYTVTMVPQVNSSDLRLMIEGAYVSNPGTGFEQRQPIGANGNVQQQFASIKPRIESTCSKNTAMQPPLPSSGREGPEDTQGVAHPQPASDIAGVVLAAQRVATQQGCGDVHSSGMTTFEASCGAAITLVVECDGTSCRPVRMVNR